MLGRTVLTLVCAFNTLLLSGGIIQGWGPLHTMLKEEGQYSELCPGHHNTTASSHVSCPAQEDRLQQIFDSSFTALSAGSVVFGLMIDSAGPRAATAVGLMLVAAGNYLMAVSDSTTFDAFLPGYCLIAGGGVAPYLSHMNVGALYGPHRHALFISFICACFNLAGFVYIVPEQMSWPRRQFFLWQTAIAGFGFALSLGLYSDDNYVEGDTKPHFPVARYTRTLRRRMCPRGGESEALVRGGGGGDDMGGSKGYSRDAEGAGTPGSDEDPEEQARHPHITFRTWLKDLLPHLAEPSFQWAVIWYSFTLLIVTFVGGAIPNMMKDLHDTGTYANTIYPVVGGLAFVFNPIVGVWLDHGRFGYAFYAANLSNQLVLLGTIVPSLQFQVVTCLLYAVQKAILFAVFFAYLALEFEPDIYGTLVALCTAGATLVGLGSLALVPLVQDTLHGQYTWVNVALAALCLPLYALGYIVRRKERRHSLTVQHK